MIDYLVSIIQLLGGIVLVSGYPAQFKKLIKRKCADDFSKVWPATIATGIWMMEPYAIWLVVSEGTGHAFLATNTLGGIVATALFLLVLKYQRRK